MCYLFFTWRLFDTYNARFFSCADLRKEIKVIGLLKKIFYGRAYRAALARWRRAEGGEGQVTGIDNMDSNHLGAPNAAYYKNQEPHEFDAKLKNIRKKTDALLRKPL